jgi:Mor family transcriptional regulator
VKAHILYRKTCELLVPSKGTGLQKNAVKTKYTFMSSEKSAGQHYYITMGNKYFESVVSLNIWEKP